ncbi:phage holin [Heyndrickxia oleronia]|uniref:phage holin n=1 Tax=Heyndrickxia oleronia TaxID=38875 RepID=UPI0023EEBF07|nr:phage holin [Heyndrickxia oleronia]
MDKGTVIRTIVLALALMNQFLVGFGLYEIPGTEQEQTAVISSVFTFVAAAVAWFKNNYLTAKGKKQRAILKDKGLTK